MNPPASRATPVSGTVVIAQRVRPGLEDDYLRWQAEINGQCRTFPGCEDIDVVAPVAGVQDDFVVVFRFDTFEHLDAWLRSGVRQRLLARGRSLFATDARQQVLASESGAAPSAGMVISTHVRPGHEQDYRAWQDTIDEAASRFPGFVGHELFPPIPTLQDDWVAVVRFETGEQLEAWIHSDVRGRLIGDAERHWDKAQVEKIGGGFPGWFAAGARHAGQAFIPPDWKQAMTVLLVLYPTVMLLARYLSPAIAFLPLAESMFVGNLVSVAILTWVLMPIVTRVFSFWLSPPRSALTEALGIGIVLAGFAAAIAIFSRLG